MIYQELDWVSRRWADEVVERVLQKALAPWMDGTDGGSRGGGLLLREVHFYSGPQSGSLMPNSPPPLTHPPLRVTSGQEVVGLYKLLSRIQAVVQYNVCVLNIITERLPKTETSSSFCFINELNLWKKWLYLDFQSNILIIPVNF